MSGGHARISRRFKVRTNLPTISFAAIGDMQGQSMASRDIRPVPLSPSHFPRI
jgi:hypothetical protein